MKKLFILLTLLSISLFGCAPTNTNGDPIIDDSDENLVENLLASLDDEFVPEELMELFG